MKKLLALLVVAAAVCSQAASINWSVTQIKSSSDKTQPGKEYLGLFFIVDTTTNPQKPVTVESITKLLDDGDIAGAVTRSTYQKNATDAGAISLLNQGSYAQGTTIQAFSVILDAKTADAAKNYIITGTMERTAGATGAMAFSFGSQANNTTFKPAGVPEPATGALALAGIALLFRRRKA